jgi:hypothetical protein
LNSIEKVKRNDTKVSPVRKARTLQKDDTTKSEINRRRHENFQTNKSRPERQNAC